MEEIARRSSTLLLLATAALAQVPDRAEPPAYEGDPWQRIERENKLIELQWRRNANGDLEWAIAGRKDATFARLFPDALDGAIAPCGLAAWAGPLLHRGDLLSVTDGEEHFRRLGIATGTPELAALARAPLGKTPSRVDELDRLVAVDVLLARGDAGAKAALAQVAGDEQAPAAVRERAAGKAPRRERLAAADLSLPARADLFVTIDHARLFDSRALMPVARLTGLVTTSLVLDKLKRPRLDDAALGQAESDSCLEVAFELVRRLGAVRFDHSCVALTWTQELGGDLTWAVVAAGSFEPDCIGRELGSVKRDDFEVTVAEGAATASWAGGSTTVASRRATAHASGVEVAPRPGMAKDLLREGAHALHAHAPAGSKVLAGLQLFGAPKAVACDLTITNADPVVVEIAFTMASEEAAADASEKVATLLERMAEQNGGSDLLATLEPAKVTVAKEVVTLRKEIPQSRFPGADGLRKWTLERAQELR